MMKKKKYAKPIVSVYATEGETLLAGSGEPTKEKYNFVVDGVRENPNEIIWGNPDDIDSKENAFGWE